MIPMKDVTANPIGIVNNCDQKASLGLIARDSLAKWKILLLPMYIGSYLRANRAKSASFTMSVAKFAMDDMIPLTIAHARAEP